MRFKVSHPHYSLYDFYLLSYNEVIEAQINRLGPTEIINSAYDWPRKSPPFQGWTDTINSLWWPRGADNFSSCILLLDDARVAKIKALIDAQVNADYSYQSVRPYLTLHAMLAPKEGATPGEGYNPANIAAISTTNRAIAATETELMAWKLYPLPPVPLTDVDASDTFQGMWLLPLVDLRYFYRNVPLNKREGGSSSSAVQGGLEFPLIDIDHEEQPDWMPPLRAYPDDLAGPLHYEAIPNNGTHPEIDPIWSWGPAADKQARMENWRVVCRDVRSNYNAEDGQTQHTEFTGVLADYPDAHDAVRSYHLDACRLAAVTGNVIAGGLCDQEVVFDFVARKLQFLFRINSDNTAYSILLYTTTGGPTLRTQFYPDNNGPGIEERTHVPKVFLGPVASSRYPEGTHYDDLLTAARQWALLYHLWRRKQAFFKFPGIAPVIPNGHAAVIKWDFSANDMSTTYVAVEGVEGTDDDGITNEREGRWGRIDGEGLATDGLAGWYAWTELEDADGTFSVMENGIVGTVQGVNGEEETFQPARDDADKVGVPIGFRVFMKPGTPYLDIDTGTIFDHFRFTTADIMQPVRIIPGGRTNSRGEVEGYVLRYNPDTGDVEDWQLCWIKQL